MTDRWLRAELADVTCDEATLRFALLDVNGSTCAQERLESAESENGAGIELAPARHMLLLRVHDAYARYVSAVEPFAREMDEIRAAQAARSHARCAAAAQLALQDRVLTHALPFTARDFACAAPVVASCPLQ